MQSFAGGFAIYLNKTGHAIESIVDVIPSDSWESEDGTEKDGFKELFPAKNCLELNGLYMFSIKKYLGEPPAKKLHIGYKDNQSPPPDLVLVG